MADSPGRAGAPPIKVRPSARYEEIERWLREKVLAGTPGDPLPSEAELALRFDVSRMTARQAVQNLAAEGLVRRQRGSGTYVAPRPLHRNTGKLLSFTDEMHRRGLQVSSQLLAAELRDATAGEVQALRLEPGARVVSVSRLRLADGVPMAIERAALRPDCAAVLAADLEGGSLHQALRDMGREPAVALSWISARTATATEARLLKTSSKAALLVEVRIIFDQDDVPLEHTETAYLGDRYVIDAVFSLSGDDDQRDSVLDPDTSALLRRST